MSRLPRTDYTRIPIRIFIVSLVIVTSVSLAHAASITMLRHANILGLDHASLSSGLASAFALGLIAFAFVRRLPRR